MTDKSRHPPDTLQAQKIFTELETSEKGILNIRTDLLTLFWHFMGILWVYLYFFLTINLK